MSKKNTKENPIKKDTNPPLDGYDNWLKKYKPSPNNEELNEMEKELPLNNSNYQLLVGA